MRAASTLFRLLLTSEIAALYLINLALRNTVSQSEETPTYVAPFKVTTKHLNEHAVAQDVPPAIFILKQPGLIRLAQRGSIASEQLHIILQALDRALESLNRSRKRRWKRFIHIPL